MSGPPVRRVLMTGDTVGGVWTFTMELAQALSEQGIEVLLAAMGGMPSPKQGEEAARIANLRLAGSDLKLEWMEDPWRDVAAAGEWLRGLERQFAPCVVHLNTLSHGALPWQAPVVLSAHSCVASWWAAVKSEPLPPQWDRYRNEVRRSLQSVNLLAAPSEAMLASLHDHYGPGLPQSVAIPNGRTAGHFRSGPKEPFILTAGRLWDEAKNVAALDRIAARLTWPVYVAGARRHPNGSTPSLDDCHLLGHLPPEDLSGWYSRAAIFALPARYEPFGLSAIEAALSGCALVLGDIPSQREIWNDAALFVPPEDTGALEKTLRMLIADGALREEMAARATARAREFTPARMASAYLEAYRWVAERSAACAS